MFCCCKLQAEKIKKSEIMKKPDNELVLEFRDSIESCNSDDFIDIGCRN